MNNRKRIIKNMMSILGVHTLDDVINVAEDMKRYLAPEEQEKATSPTHVTGPDDNVFEDLGFEKEEAKKLQNEVDEDIKTKTVVDKAAKAPRRKNKNNNIEKTE